MDKVDYWVPWRSRHTNEVHADGPYDRGQSRRERKSLMDTLGWEAEVGIPFQAETKAEALEAARRQVGS